MGWSQGVNNEGRTIGYGVEGTCEQDGCGGAIDLGLAHCCGGQRAPTLDLAASQTRIGCGGYFCLTHLFLVRREGEDRGEFVCGACLERPGYTTAELQEV